jgi:hypothetical protein
MIDDDISEEMRTQLTDFAAEFMTEAEAKQRLKEVFEKHMGIARISKGAGNYEQLIESYLRASAAATFLELMKKQD